MILDTNALSAFLDGDIRLKEMLAGHSTLSLPVIVLGEYRFGLLGSRLRSAIEVALDELEAIVNVLPVDIETVGPYAEICGKLKKAGTPIPLNDVWISALAVQHSLPIVSRDRHFDRIPSVKRLEW